jgi:hypothetical protein
MIWARRIGLALLVAWALFWVWFNIASAFGEGGGQRIEPQHLVLAGIIATVTAVAWRWPIVGAVALVALAGLGLGIFGPVPFLVLTLFAPPVVAAALLAISAPTRPLIAA